MDQHTGKGGNEIRRKEMVGLLLLTAAVYLVHFIPKPSEEKKEKKDLFSQYFE